MYVRLRAIACACMYVHVRARSHVRVCACMCVRAYTRAWATQRAKARLGKRSRVLTKPNLFCSLRLIPPTPLFRRPPLPRDRRSSAPVFAPSSPVAPLSGGMIFPPRSLSLLAPNFRVSRSPWRKWLRSPSRSPWRKWHEFLAVKRLLYFGFDALARDR